MNKFLVCEKQYLLTRFNKLSKVHQLLKLKIFNRSLKIQEKYLNSTVNIYNGLIFYPLLIKLEMIGLNFGSFSFTRKKVSHIDKNKIKLKKKSRK